MSSQPSPPALLEVKDLHARFATGSGIARAVDGVSFSVAPGERFGLVGESGCGKSVSFRAVLGLLPRNASVEGSALFDGEGDLIGLAPERLRRVRGARIAAVFQDPTTYLNPVLRIETQLVEVLRLHRGLGAAEATKEAVALLRRVRLADPERAARSYPFQLSGGMRQRALIAMALACRPRLLVADEPTTALDVTLQAAILDLLRELTEEGGAALWLITHDLGVIARTCHRVAVMYAGRIVETGPAETITRSPAHPYTRGLLAAAKHLEEGRVRATIPGQVHSPTNHPPGCRFHLRCPEALPSCATHEPPETALSPGHAVRCWLYATFENDHR